jgi:hypothetical protein
MAGCGLRVGVLRGKRERRKNRLPEWRRAQFPAEGRIAFCELSDDLLPTKYFRGQRYANEKHSDKHCCIADVRGPCVALPYSFE